MGKNRFLGAQSAPEAILSHCVFIHLTIALRQERGWEGKSTTSRRGDHRRENNKEIKRWVKLQCPPLDRALVWIWGPQGRQSGYKASDVLSITQPCAEGKRFFMVVSEEANKYSFTGGKWPKGWRMNIWVAWQGTMWDTSLCSSVCKFYNPHVSFSQSIFHLIIWIKLWIFINKTAAKALTYEASIVCSIPDLFICHLT